MLPFIRDGAAVHTVDVKKGKFRAAVRVSAYDGELIGVVPIVERLRDVESLQSEGFTARIDDNRRTGSAAGGLDEFRVVADVARPVSRFDDRRCVGSKAGAEANAA